MRDATQIVEIYGTMLPLAILLIKNEEDQQYIAELYLEYRRYIYKIAHSILSNNEDVEDAVQETAKRMCDYVQKFKDLECHKIKKYVVKICCSVCINIYNMRIRESPRCVYATDEAIESFLESDTDMHTIVFSSVHAKDFLPSEHAFAYEIKLEAIKHHG